MKNQPANHTFHKTSTGEKTSRKSRLPRWEQWLLDLLERHMLLLAVLLASLLALYLRKIAVWWNYEGILGHFDLHANHTESSFYYLLLKIAEYIPILPLHSFKWLGGLSDFALALLCARIAGGHSRLKAAILYLLCLFSPVVFLRGIVWAQPDSTALVLLLAACVLHLHSGAGKNRGMYFSAIWLAGMGIALAPCLLIVFLIYLTISPHKLDSPGRSIPTASENSPAVKTTRLWLTGMAVLAVTALLQTVSALLLNQSPWEGLWSGLRFGTYHPLTGALYETPGEWLTQMLILFGLPASVISLLYAAKSREGGPSCTAGPVVIAVSIQFMVTLLYGSCLFS
ncbi:MAG: hypothetical protein NC081_01255 [Roseburia sp.]|nr:hypothetical protein [Roseburia sp.]